MTEVIVLLPFFFIAFVGTYYLHNMYLGRQIAATYARACVWEWASKGCPGDGKPAQCKSTNEGASVSSEDLLGGWGGKLLHKVNKFMPGMEKIVDEVLGTPATASYSHQVAIPAFNQTTPQSAWKSSSTASTSAAISTMCNASPESWGDVAKDTFCHMVGDHFPGC